ncbi:transposon ty3-i Gag-Pol polyprotein [Plakobranchus ocellatus]|uniref:Transposon ty3-i Gag-Pol polyprotein n=1 Tax=Plakobranchus ocellatus TaxID=259542 RepID=A0AAV4C7J2_9GAST|nr:transposon ty3-i Gag-Pol polyprotein [Plakobranchus ocellatus]
MSLYPDPKTEAINAFLHSWDEYVYIFPTFNLIPRVLKKLVEDQTERALIIVSMCTTQSWYPKLETMWKSHSTLKAIKNTSVSSIRHKSNSSALQETEVDGFSYCSFGKLTKESYLNKNT